MTVITDIEIPADQFALGRLFATHGDIAIEVERIIPLGKSVIPLFWVEGVAPETIEATIRSDPLTVAVRQLTTVEDRTLFEVQWGEDVNGLLGPLRESHADILRASGDASHWTFRLQFHDRELLSTFRDKCQDSGIQMMLHALYNPTPAVDPASALTDEQFDTLATAYEHGYFEVPRGITMGELADLIGISTNAASQRMRRGLSTIVGDTIETIVLEGEHELPDQTE